jgi:diguanylate cyclase (GGDEF)-like protein
MAAAEARQAGARAEELEHLVIMGRALGNALDRDTLQQVLWRHLPLFVREPRVWVLEQHHGQWTTLLEDTPSSDGVLQTREALATRALADQRAEAAHVEGVRVDDTDCFPMQVGGSPVGVIGIAGVSELSPLERRTIGAAATLMAIAVRNVQLFAEIKENGLRDGLTGCVNRTHAIETLDAELRRARRSGRFPSVVMFDIDHFKSINDRYGHLCGDRLLAAVGKTLRELLRSSDVACRYGGDEFLVLLPDTPPAGAEHVAATLVKGLAGMRVPAAEAYAVVTASLGVAHAGPEDDPATLIARADAALYQAKRGGRNRFCVALASQEASQIAQVIPMRARPTSA